MSFSARQMAGCSRFALLGLVLLATGCASWNLKSAKAGGGAAVDGSTEPPAPPKEIASFRVTDPEPPAVVDKELDSVPPEVQPKVEQWIAYFQGKGRPHMERYLARSTRYIQLMKRIMRENGLPEDLVYVALIESGFSSRATSRAAAVGYWQFIKGTGRRYGLEISSMVDERRDPVLSTQAAAEYFKGLYSIFGSWYLSMASYNVGENRVKREVMNHFTRDFWELARRRRFPKETVNYIPKFIAARLIAREPEKYGFTDIEYDKPLEFELIKVNKALNMKSMAQKMNMDYEDLKLMNPKYRGEIAPMRSAQGLEIRIPVGQTQQALAAAQASYVDKVEFIADAGETETYRVRSGDSLYTIARHYHTTVAWLRDVNDLKSGKKLRIGMRVQVPERSGGRSHSGKAISKIARVEKPEKVAKSDDVEKAASSPEVVTKKGVYYIVQPGDTLSEIADEYDSSINELRRMNKLGKSSKIKAGMRLRVPKDEGLPTALEDPTPNLAVNSKAEKSSGALAAEHSLLANADSLSHTVKSGENLSTIARQYGVTVQEIRDANNLKRKSKINAGTTLLIPVKSKPSTSVDTGLDGLDANGGNRNLASHPQKISAYVKLQKSLRTIHHAFVKVHVVRRGEDLTHIAKKYQVSLNTLREKNRLENESKILVGSKLLIPLASAQTN